MPRRTKKKKKKKKKSKEKKTKQESKQRERSVGRMILDDTGTSRDLMPYLFICARKVVEVQAHLLLDSQIIFRFKSIHVEQVCMFV